MGLFGLLKRKNDTPPPWIGRPSIFDHVRSHLDGQERLPLDAEDLPDAELFYQGGKVRWIAGGLEGAMGHHGGIESDARRAGEIAGLIRRVATSGKEIDKVSLYKAVQTDGILNIIDELLPKMGQMGIPIEPHLRDFAQWLAHKAPDREPVKLGIALLGAMCDGSAFDSLKILGKHEEFTLYAAVAIGHLCEDPEPEYWSLAKAVQGWGRIHLVERLADSKNPEIKSWLLREGYRNRVMIEYLALPCAMAGELHLELARRDVDEGLLDTSGELITAMINGAPGPGIEEYPFASAAISAYLERVTHQNGGLTRMLAVRSIRDFLLRLAESGDEEPKNGWSRDRVEALQQVAEAILSLPHWEDQVRAGLHTTDDAEFFTVKQAADLLGMDIFPVFWSRVRERSGEPGRWYDLMKSATPENIGAILEFAEANLPLAGIATGPSDEMGLGPEFSHHSCLDYILQDLGPFPGQGYALVEAGLRSPVTRNRNFAAKVLGQWGREHWPARAKDVLELAISQEPDDDCRELLGKVFRGEPLDASNPE